MLPPALPCPVSPLTWLLPRGRQAAGQAGVEEEVEAAGGGVAQRQGPRAPQQPPGPLLAQDAGSAVHGAPVPGGARLLRRPPPAQAVGLALQPHLDEIHGGQDHGLCKGDRPPPQLWGTGYCPRTPGPRSRPSPRRPPRAGGNLTWARPAQQPAARTRRAGGAEAPRSGRGGPPRQRRAVP